LRPLVVALLVLCAALSGAPLSLRVDAAPRASDGCCPASDCCCAARDGSSCCDEDAGREPDSVLEAACGCGRHAPGGRALHLTVGRFCHSAAPEEVAARPRLGATLPAPPAPASHRAGPATPPPRSSAADSSGPPSGA